MPKFYFDVEDGVCAFHDADGLQLARAAAAFDQMRRTLLEIGKQVITSDSQRQLIGTIRDDKGVLWRARLRFDVECRPGVRTGNDVGLFLTG